jgi:hypothetical protein
MSYFAVEPNQNPNNIAKDVFKEIVSAIKDLQALVQSQQLFQMFEDSGRSEEWPFRSECEDTFIIPMAHALVLDFQACGESLWMAGR